MASADIGATLKTLCQRLEKVSDALDHTHSGHAQLAREQDTLRQQHQTLISLTAQLNQRLGSVEEKLNAPAAPRKRAAPAAAKPKKPRATAPKAKKPRAAAPKKKAPQPDHVVSTVAAGRAAPQPTFVYVPAASPPGMW